MPHLRLVTVDSAPLRWVSISLTALQTIAAEIAVGGHDLETGGIILGRDDPATRATEIVLAGGPGPQAIREPRRFLRDLEYAKALAREAWHTHRAQWIGEWHTHPHAEPVPSDVDLSSYARHLNDPELAFDHFVSLIAGVRQDEPPVLTAWIVDRHSTRLAQLHQAEQDAHDRHL